MKTKKQTIGQRIKELRESKGLTQSQLAEELNFSDKTISKREKGGAEPDSGTLVKLAKIFNVTLDYLLTGVTTLTETESVSKIELACREDNIALLDGVDVEAFDDKGKNLEYYAKIYDAKRVLNYLVNYKIDKYAEKNKTSKTFHIAALPKDSNNEDDLVLLAGEGPYHKAAEVCAEYEKQGYHKFRIFREIGVNEKIEQDYQYFFCYCLDYSGFNKIQISVAILDDNQSGILRLKIYKDETYKVRKHDDKGKLVPDYYPESSYEVDAHAYVRPTVMKAFMSSLSELRVSKRENKSRGCPVHDLFYVMKSTPEDNDLYCHKFYVSPGRDLYKRFIKEIQKLCFESLKPYDNKKFVNFFNVDIEPYYRENMAIFESTPIFKEIDLEQKEIKEGRFDLSEELKNGKLTDGSIKGN